MMTRIDRSEISRQTVNRRRLVLASSAYSLFIATGASFAQQRKPPVVIGFLEGGSRATSGHRLVAFKEGMAALGWKEGVQYVVEERWTDGDTPNASRLASELATKRPAVIVAAPNGVVILSAKAAPGIPIVQANGASPVRAGLAKSLAQPGGMVTGVTNVTESVHEKYLEMLLLAAPKLRRVGFLLSVTRASDRNDYHGSVQRMAAHSKVEARIAVATNREQIPGAFAELTDAKVEGLVLMPSSWHTHWRQLIVDLAMQRRWPVLGGPHEFAEAGALLSYGNDRTDLYRRAASYVDKILKGAKPGDLPIEQPLRIELVLNYKTAKALGLKLPAELVVRADRVIE